MLPAFSPQNAAHGHLTYPVLAGQSADGFAFRMAAAGLSDAHFGHLAVANLASYLHPSFCDLVCHVVHLTSQEQVLGIDAAGAVA